MRFKVTAGKVAWLLKMNTYDGFIIFVNCKVPVAFILELRGTHFMFHLVIRFLAGLGLGALRLRARTPKVANIP